MPVIQTEYVQEMGESGKAKHSVFIKRISSHNGKGRQDACTPEGKILFYMRTEETPGRV